MTPLFPTPTPPLAKGAGGEKEKSALRRSFDVGMFLDVLVPDINCDDYIVKSCNLVRESYSCIRV